jgi:hypothetical protein
MNILKNKFKKAGTRIYFWLTEVDQWAEKK